MTSERWNEIESLYHRALEQRPADRHWFLHEACAGDEVLQCEVESLLAFAEGAGGFLEELPGDIVAGAVQHAPEPLAGRTLGHYEIVSPLAHGGFGDVYLARDMDLGRKVALKLLRRTITGDREQLKRFRQEAHSASALNHPNIVTVHETGEVDGLHFIATEYVDGQTLQDRIAAGPADLRESIEISIQVVTALAAAHAAGIVHRDVKPANIMVRSDGYVKVLDFGIAKLMNSVGEQVHTVSGAVIGSPLYMSPEQALGRSIDARTDIFSFGVIFHQLVTNKLPSAGGAAPDSAAAYVHGAATSLESPINATLRRIFAKTLAENRDQRYSSATELLNDLRALKLELEARARQGLIKGPRAGAPRRRSIAAVLAVALLAVAIGGVWFWKTRRAPRMGVIPSVAVLPFADRSPERNQEYFSDGLSDELLNSLVRVPGLRVAAATSSFRFKGTTEDPQAIGKKLNVGALLEGSVRKQDNRVRIAVRLIKCSDGFPIWAETFDRDMKDIIAVQEEIGGAVARSLQVALLTRKPAAPRAAPKPEAYTAYLQGQYFLRGGKEQLQKAIAFFEQAIRLDPGYGAPWAMLGETRIRQAELGYLPFDQGFQEAREAVQRALALDPNMPDAFIVLASIQRDRDLDWAAADRSVQLAGAMAPGSIAVARTRGMLAGVLGRWDEAIAQYRRAVESDPLHAVSHYNLGMLLHYVGQNDQARAALANAIALSPTMEQSHSLLGRVYLAQLQPKSALEEMRKEQHPVLRLHGLALAYYALARTREADAALAELIDKYQSEAPYQIAEVYGFRGEADRAFQWLERCLELRDPGISDIKGDPLLKGLRRDPRYSALLKKLRLPLY